MFFNREKLQQNVATEAEKSKIKHWPCVVLFSSYFSRCILTQSHDRMTTNTLVQKRCQTKWRQTPIYSILSVFLFRCRFPVFFKHRISLPPPRVKIRGTGPGATLWEKVSPGSRRFRVNQGPLWMNQGTLAYFNTWKLGHYVTPGSWHRATVKNKKQKKKTRIQDE